MKSHIYRLVAIAVLFVLGTSCAVGRANAQIDFEGLIPGEETVSVESHLTAGETTHPPLRVTPDKSEIINLDKEVDRVVIGNDGHVNILLDTKKRMIVVPRAPGATHFTLLGKDGDIIMQRHVIVAYPNEKYVRIRQPCVDAGSCLPIRMFYCPGMCHEIGLVGEDGKSFSGSVATTDEDDDDVTLKDLLGSDNGDDGGDGEGGE